LLLPLPPLAAAALRDAQQLIAAGRLPEAAAAAKRARAAAPSHAAIPSGIAEALARKGLTKEALQQRFLACHLAPDDPVARRALADALPGADLTGASPAVQGQLAKLLWATDVSPLDIGPIVLSLLRPHPGFARLATPGGIELLLDEPECQALLAHPLWQALLARSLQTEPTLELLLTRLRQAALQRHTAATPGGLLAPGLEPLAALALQADLGANAWPERPEETAAVEALQTALEAEPPAALDASVLLLACYRPLPHWPLAAPAEGGLLRAAWERLIEEPRRRAGLGAALPALTPVADATSAAVRAQYEANPYPRWIATNLPRPQPLAEVIRRLFPWVPAAGLPARQPLQVLVAGCGTGEQAVRTARRFSDAEVLAVDLSRASLGHAALRASQMQLDNLVFAQADLLRLGGLGRSFDVIEAVGVLHHLADPLAGWRVLRGLLAPGGLMRIGLYSRLGRQPLAAARQLVGAGDGRPLTQQRLREARALLLQHAGDPAVRFTFSFFDAYDLDGLRDLLFHVQEQDVTLPQIGRWLGQLRLRFLGFELTDRAIRDGFRAAQPTPGAEQDLAAWDAYERANPGSFASMYRFWVQAL